MEINTAAPFVTAGKAEASILIGLGRDASKRSAPNNYESLYNNFMHTLKSSMARSKPGGTNLFCGQA